MSTPLERLLAILPSRPARKGPRPKRPAERLRASAPAPGPPYVSSARAVVTYELTDAIFRHEQAAVLLAAISRRLAENLIADP